MTETHPSFCRMCHSACPILVDVEDGVAVKVSGDPSSEIYHGYTCIKGRALPEMHAHPDRLLHSLSASARRLVRADLVGARRWTRSRRRSRASSTSTDRWRSRCTAARSDSRTRSTAPLTNAFREALGNPRGWVATSIDQPGKTIAQGLMGVWMALHQGPATADVCMIIGSNPLISIAAGLPQADPRKWLHDAKRRGFKLIVIDPRRHETASQADIYLQPKPAEDIAIVGGMIRLIVDEGLYDHEFVAAETQGLDELRRAVDPFDPATVARRADIPVDDFVAAARLFATAGRGVAVAGTGPGMSSARGTLLEYLILALNALCGRYLRAGELVWNPGTLVEAGAALRAGLGTVPGRTASSRSCACGVSATRSSGRRPPRSPTRSSSRARARSGRSSAVAATRSAAWPDQLQGARGVGVGRAAGAVRPVDVVDGQARRLRDRADAVARGPGHDQLRRHAPRVRAGIRPAEAVGAVHRGGRRRRRRAAT